MSGFGFGDMGAGGAGQGGAGGGVPNNDVPRLGWMCPSCRRCYAPHVGQCWRCPPKAEQGRSRPYTQGERLARARVTPLADKLRREVEEARAKADAIEKAKKPKFVYVYKRRSTQEITDMLRDMPGGAVEIPPDLLLRDTKRKTLRQLYREFRLRAATLAQR